MSDNLDALKGQLGALAPKERAELAHFLIRSLDEEADSGAEAAWDTELRRRMIDGQSGRVQGKQAERVFSELKEKRSRKGDAASPQR